MKAKIIDGKIKIGLPKVYHGITGTYPGGFDKQPKEIHEAEGFYPVVTPIFNSELQRLGKIYFDKTNEVFTYPVEDIPQAELDERKQRELDMLDSQFDRDAAKRLLRKVAEPILQDETNLTEQDIQDAKILYKQWRGTGIAYKVDDKVVYNEILYKVIQAHTSQTDWTPDVAISLFTPYRVPGTIAVWVQPESTNPYMTGDKVTHNSSTWISDVNDNVWEPGVYGWSEI